MNYSYDCVDGLCVLVWLSGCSVCWGSAIRWEWRMQGHLSGGVELQNRCWCQITMKWRPLPYRCVSASSFRAQRDLLPPDLTVRTSHSGEGADVSSSKWLCLLSGKLKVQHEVNNCSVLELWSQVSRWGDTELLVCGLSWWHLHVLLLTFSEASSSQVEIKETPRVYYQTLRVLGY